MGARKDAKRFGWMYEGQQNASKRVANFGVVPKEGPPNISILFVTPCNEVKTILPP